MTKFSKVHIGKRYMVLPIWHNRHEYTNLFMRRVDYGKGVFHCHDEELRQTVMLEF